MIIDPVVLLLFTGTCIMLTLSPGPVVSLLVAESLTYGPRVAIAAYAGAGAMAIIHLTIYCAGFSFLVANLPPEAFEVVRYLGIAFLLYMAWGRFTAPADETADADTRPDKSYKKAFMHGFLIHALNPKAILFLVVFFPPFVNPDQPVMPQLVLLSIVFYLVGTITDFFWIFTADKARNWLHRSGGWRLINRISGGALVAGAALLIFLE